MKKDTIALGLAVIAVVIAIIANLGGGAPALKGTTNFDDLVVASVSTSGTVTALGAISETNSGTSTLNMKSTSATKGWCTEFHATSSNTLLNLTWAASTTAVTTVGVAPIVRYGACN